jgi:signal transduction histidine kinase
MSIRTIRKNYLLALSFVAYLVTLLLLLSETDRQYYQVEKEEIIKYNFRALFPHDTRRLQEVSRQILVQHGRQGAVDDSLETEWRGIAGQMLSGEGCVFRIRIVPRDAEELIVQRDDEKFQRLNGFSNTLFYRSFQNVVSYEIAGSGEAPWLGLLSFHYTTPGNYEPIIALTTRYRLWTLLIFAVVTTCYIFIVRRLILPTRRVVSRIDAVASSSPRVMPRPTSLLEKAYNDLARDAILLRLGQSVRNLTTENPTYDRAAILAHVPKLLVELLDYRAVVAFELSANESGSLSASSSIEATDGNGSEDYKGYCLDHVLTPDGIPGLVDAGRLVHGECVVCDITLEADRPHLTCLAVFLSPDTRRATPDTRQWHMETVDLLADQLRETLAAFDLHRRFIRRERSRANINLARNLGHDLTNIIATSRLDIRTVRKVLDKAGAGQAEDTGHRRLLRDAMGGLLNSTRLLQEVVNIYRSFSYINRPRFETVAINNVLDEIIDVFALSLPARTVVRRSFADGIPDCSIEPRLIKLALFNLLTNAIDAVKQNVDPERPEGVITVSTSKETGTDQVCISVRDNGTGILGADGTIASQPEIDNVFRYGVSTKTEDGGEGLGLSWVWTIVEEFHDGKVQARNHPDGGAEFLLFIGSRGVGCGEENEGF